MSAKEVLSTPAFQNKVHKVMHEYKARTLKTRGKVVRKRSQAIAIALSEARRHTQGKK